MPVGGGQLGGLAAVKCRGRQSGHELELANMAGPQVQLGPLSSLKSSKAPGVEACTGIAEVVSHSCLLSQRQPARRLSWRDISGQRSFDKVQKQVCKARIWMIACCIRVLSDGGYGMAQNATANARFSPTCLRAFGMQMPPRGSEGAHPHFNEHNHTFPARHSRRSSRWQGHALHSVHLGNDPPCQLAQLCAACGCHIATCIMHVCVLL